MIIYYRLFYFLALLMLSVLCNNAYAAAPFCVEGNNISLQCYYYDAKQCREEANIIDGNCKVNKDEISLPDGYGNYCLVYSATIIECVYLDYNTCNVDALRKNGVCVRNYTKPEPLPEFEFQTDDAYQSF